VILFASVIIWALGYFPRTVEYSQDYEDLIVMEMASVESNTADEEVSERVDILYREMEAERQEHSYIGRIGKAVEPVIAPLGFDWKMGIALLTGFAAKEIVVSTMGVLYEADENLVPGEHSSLEQRLRTYTYSSGPRKGQRVFTPLVAFSFLVFVLFYLPCIAVIAAVGREAGSWKWAAFVVFYTTALAWLASFAVYQLGTLFHLGGI